MRFMAHPGGQRGDHGHGHGHRQRARRGAIRGAVLRLLADRPMHGYELIGELEERTGGRWRPSPGSVYPTLAQLEDEGLVQAVVSETDDKKRYELTDLGRAWLDEHPEESFGRPGPGGPDFGRFGFGGPGGFGDRGELRRLGGEIFGQLRQLGRYGSPAQHEQATEILTRARTELYAVLAQPPAEPTDDAPDADPES
jgi:DNA-binding PadR family transcriptional regulator